MSKDPHRRAKIIGNPGCISKDTILSFRRGKRKAGRLYTIEDAYYKFHGIPREKSGKWQRRSGKNYLWNPELSLFTLSLKNENHIGYHQVDDIVYSGIKTTYLVKTKNSYLRATKNHPFLTSDNKFIPLENLNINDEVVCRQLEIKKQGKNSNGNQNVAIERICSIEKYGKEKTYDIVMKDPYHNFCANNFVLHNCGKTTYLLKLIGEAAKKYDPERIGAVSLTNAAIEEMKERVKQQTGLPRSTAKNIRTIHSTCFNLLRLNKDKVADKKIGEFNEVHPEWEMPKNVEITEDDFDAVDHKTTKQNKARFARIQTLRHQMIPESEWTDKDDIKMYRAWKGWMWENDYIDFTGMIERTFVEELKPDIDILLVDEAQDMSMLEVKLLELWGEDTVSTVYAGDSDQAILRFAGAVPEAFMNLKQTWVNILGQSYRVPKKVHEYAMKMINQIKNREDVSYLPTEIEGSVREYSDPDLSLDGTHMILGRCNYHLNRWKNFLQKNRMLWHNPYRPGDFNLNPTHTGIWRAARTYVRICRGEIIKLADFKHMIKHMIADKNIIRGMKSRLDLIELEDKIDMFGIISSGIFTESFLTFNKTLEEVFYLKGKSGELIAATEDIMEEPKTILGTYHSVKGGEATHVWLDTGTSVACLRGCLNDVEKFYDEVRVAYVGITRAKQSVGLLQSEGIRGRIWNTEEKRYNQIGEELEREMQAWKEGTL